MPELQKLVGRRVRELRENRGLSQEELAGVCNLHRTYIGLIERGQRSLSLSTVEVIAGGLGVPVSELFVGLEMPSAPQKRGKPAAVPTPEDIAAHLATIREILLETKLIDAKGYDTRYKAHRRSRIGSVEPLS
jgi:transcriptional regulator with XRE-family HTH domain